MLNFKAFISHDDSLVWWNCGHVQYYFMSTKVYVRVCVCVCVYVQGTNLHVKGLPLYGDVANGSNLVLWWPGIVRVS